MGYFPRFLFDGFQKQIPPGIIFGSLGDILKIIKNRYFFRKATLQICSSLEIESAMKRSLQGKWRTFLKF